MITGRLRRRLARLPAPPRLPRPPAIPRDIYADLARQESDHAWRLATLDDDEAPPTVRMTERADLW